MKDHKGFTLIEILLVVVILGILSGMIIPRLVGTAAIRASFEAIFANGRIPVRPEQVHRLQWMGGALHHLVERIDVPAEGGGEQTAWVIASNVYVKTAQGWRLVAHHASPATDQEAQEIMPLPHVLH